MAIFTFLICTEPYKFEAVDSLINLSEAILKKGHKIQGIFFYGSGVYNIKKNKLAGDSMRNLPERLEKFCDKWNLVLTACSTWLSFTGIQSTELIEGACQKGLTALSEMIENSDKLIVFGTGG